jgi:AP-1-like factor
VKNLEDKLNSLETSKTTLASDNQRLQLALQRVLTENEILRATSGGRARPSMHPSNSSSSRVAQDSTEAADEEAAGPGTQQEHNDSDSEAGAILTMPQVWDYIVEHPLVKSGRVDITDTVDRLRRSGKPGERGRPIFSERDVRRAIESSRRAGGDALI